MRSYPLQWPAHVPRTRLPKFSDFKDWTDHQSYLEVCDELRKMRASNIVVTSNLTLTASGTPYARQKVEDHGVAVFFTRNGKDYCIACDKFRPVSHNLHAISLTVKAIRSVERWGTAAMVDAMFAGYAALPEQAVGNDWWRILGFSSAPDDRSVLQRRYRALVKDAHPDMGGREGDFRAIESAYRAGVRALGAG